MIQQLATQIETQWRALIAGHTPAPTLVLTPGKLELNQRLRDHSSAPRPQALEQTIELHLLATTRYTLAKTPLIGALHAGAIFNPGQPDERRISLVRDEDYQIDTATTELGLTAAGVAKLSGATRLRLDYTFAGVFAIQEFKQLLHVEIHASTPRQCEQWASLFIALLLTDHDTLLESYNAKTATVYRAGDFSSRHTLDQIRIVEGEPGLGGDAPVWHLLLQASGRLELGKQTPPSFGLIEQVVSPGRTASQQAVDIAIQIAPTG